jgi:hypothetical protein
MDSPVTTVIESGVETAGGVCAFAEVRSSRTYALIATGPSAIKRVLTFHLFPSAGEKRGAAPAEPRSIAKCNKPKGTKKFFHCKHSKRVRLVFIEALWTNRKPRSKE